jgi:hypothetical protein
VPLEEQASVIVWPSLPFSEVALASQLVGVPAAAGGAGCELFEFAAGLPPSELCSFPIFEQPAPVSTIAAKEKTRQLRVVRRSDL